MKHYLHIIATAMIAMAITSCGDSNSDKNSGTDIPTVKSWHETWAEDFNGDKLDDKVWGRTERGSSDWNNNQSPDERLVELRDGCVVLRGIVNDDTSSDTQQYICGGIWTKGKKAFGSTDHPTSIQVRAKLGKGAQGAWPAIWMMPFASKEGWPDCGEIDIMERLNFETSYYSTVHSYYTYTLGNHNPENSRYTRFSADDFHVFEVQLWPDKVLFFLDYAQVFSYAKVNDGKDKQFPFFQTWYLIMDMQLGGSWVGAVNARYLPVEMEIDWVKYLEFK